VLIAVQTMNLAFVPWLGHAGLALSIGLGALVNAGWLFVGLRRRGLYRPSPGWARFALRVVAACLVLGALLWWANGGLDWLHLPAGVRAGLLAAVLATVAVAYFAVLFALGLRPHEFMRRA
jgi:putative peptidoglycan lipid II flippase